MSFSIFEIIIAGLKVSYECSTDRAYVPFTQFPLIATSDVTVAPVNWKIDIGIKHVGAGIWPNG